jgi:NTE family protein
MSQSQRKKTGLVLSGGGARGAYEAGVLYYLFVSGPKDLREKVKFDILSGTSIGALHACAIASELHQIEEGMKKIANIWVNLSVDQVLDLQIKDFLTLSSWFLGKGSRESFFPGEPIKELLKQFVDWQRLHQNIDQGYLEALTVSCTQVPTGKTVVFYETRDGRPRTFSRDPHVLSIYSRIEAEHARASAAIPFIFPSVPIDGIPYADGGLRQNTPLSPALRAGSDRLLVIGLGHEKTFGDQGEVPEWKNKLTSPIFLFAKVLNAIMLDRVDYDLIRLDHFNRLLKQGEDAFGNEFISKMNQVLNPMRKASYRYIPFLAIRPSKDLGVMAAHYLKNHKVKTKQMIMGKIIPLIAKLESQDEADLCSYLLFDGDFCRNMFELGMADAKMQHDALQRFFDGVDE